MSTIKDSLRNVERFVGRNLAGGIDHLVVFVDSPLPDVEEHLGGLGHVTCVPAYGEWWGDARPDRLNERQLGNATMTARLLARVRPVDWVFHIDGDEAVQLDIGLLSTLGREWRAVSLAPFEAVSHEGGTDDPTWFKRLLEPDELERLKSRGLVTHALNGSYFRGHTRGKVGVRPAADVQIGIHRSVDARGEFLEAYTDDALRVLHYESPDEEEFVRKWLALVSSGHSVGQRSRRSHLFRRIAALTEPGVGEDERRTVLRRLYRRTAVDDVEALRALGYLVQVDPGFSTESSHPLPEPVRDRLSLLFDPAWVAEHRPVPRPRPEA